MRVSVSFFAALRDLVGGKCLTFDLEDGSTLADVLEVIEKKHPRMQEYRGRLMLAVNLEYVREDAALKEGDDVAMFPPVSGG